VRLFFDALAFNVSKNTLFLSAIGLEAWIIEEGTTINVLSEKRDISSLILAIISGEIFFNVSFSERC
jgi:hypothetical protein